MERSSLRATLVYTGRLALVAAVWAVIVTGPWESHVEERVERTKPSGAGLLQTDVALRYQIALVALGVDSPVPTGPSDLGRMLDDREAEGAPVRDVALRRAAVALLGARAPTDEQRSEAAAALLGGVDRDEGAADLREIADGLAPDADAPAVDRALRHARALRPPWLGLFLTMRLAPTGEAGGEGAQARDTLAARSVAFLAVLALLGAFMFVAGLAGVVILIVHIALRQAARRRAAADGAPPPLPPPTVGLPVFSDTVPYDASRASGALPALPRARWGLIDGIEALTVMIAGQVGFLLAARAVLEPFGLDPHGVAPMAAAFALSGALTVLYCHWRARRSGPGYEQALGTAGRSPWAVVGWGLGGYCAMVPILFAAGLLMRLAMQEDSYSVNPAIEMTLGMTNPLEVFAMFLVVVAGAPLVEETLFRGLLFGALRARFGPAIAILFTGIAFGAMHFDPMVGPQLAIIGLTLGYVRERSGSLYPCIVLHALQNGLSFGLMVGMKL